MQTATTGCIAGGLVTGGLTLLLTWEPFTSFRAGLIGCALAGGQDAIASEIECSQDRQQ